MNRTLGCILLLCVLWLWLGWGATWWDSQEDKERRDEFEREWWKSFQRLTYEDNSTFTLLPDDVQGSVGALLRNSNKRLVLSDSEFTKDVAGTYHGEWESEHNAQTTPFWNGTLPSGYSRPDDGATGRLTMVLRSEAIENDNVNLLRGSLTLQSATGFSTLLDVEGLYWSGSGVAILHGAPEISAQSAADLVRAVPSEKLFSQAKAALSEAYTSLLSQRKRPEDVGRGDCEYHVYLQFSPGRKALVARSVMFSPACSVSVATPAEQTIVGLHAKTYTLMVMRYAAVAALGMVALLLLLERQMRHTPTPARLARVSYHTLSMQAIVDSHVFVLHAIACTAVGGLVFLVAGAVAFVMFTALLVLVMRYVAAVWRAQQSSAVSPDDCRRCLVRMYVTAYVALVLGIVATYAYLDTQRPLPAAVLAALLVVAHAYWVPQIWRNVKRNTSCGLRWDYIVGTTAVRLFFPLYAFAYTNNIAFVSPAPLVWGLVAFSVAQTAALMMQDLLGPRFFVPEFLTPQAHDYHPAVSLPDEEDLERNSQSSDAAAVCAVCIQPVDTTLEDNRLDPTPSYMLTPCAHMYHTECLQQWMDIKLECPVCRARLPPL
ncbi:hypothetical protein GGI19_005639 [Coemansia pectinata]|uniref:RING-type E3 ubiquitin transferase n=1 Tax=Coemansia pectinata TaxID=1052879 RepID=A0A9W8GVL8_9FUNG|nr:hypothetical protein GGI19_005639 [Coemansia pectinata]